MIKLVLFSMKRVQSVRRIAATLLILTALSTVVTLARADVTGDWTSGGRGLTLTFTFIQDGSRLTGTVRASTGEIAPVTDGRIEGDKLSFTVNLGEDARLLFNGIVKGNEIELNAKADGVGFSGGGSMALKRAR